MSLRVLKVQVKIENDIEYFVRKCFNIEVVKVRKLFEYFHFYCIDWTPIK